MLMDRMGVQLILPVKVSITIGIRFNFDGGFDGHGDVDVTCKQTLVGGYLSQCKCTLPDIFIVP